MNGVQIALAPLTARCAAALEAAGAPAEHALVTARILVDTEAMGLTTHGVIRVRDYAQRMRRGGIDARATPEVDQRAAALAIVDGHNALGPLVASRALETAIDLARAGGIAYVGARNSNHFGAIAPYARLACEAGFVMLAGTNASVSMPPAGGAAVVMGNNPFGIAAPAPDGMHFILDIAMSMVSRGRIRAMRDEGMKIPEGWATDASGRPTTDPVAALAGFMLAIGGHKGAGLALGVDLLAGVLSGGRFLSDVSSWIEQPDDPQRVSHFFVLIDPVRLIGAQAYAAAITRFRKLVRDTPCADADAPVHLPGEGLLARRAAALRDGVTIPAALLAELDARH